MPISRDYLDSGQRQSGTPANGSKAGNDHTRAGHLGNTDSSPVEQPAESERTSRPESRQELIARIKRDQRPLWLQDTGDVSRSVSTLPPTLLPAAEVDINERTRDESIPTPLELASGIERPRSALHAGDFHEEQEQQNQSRARRIPFEFGREEQTAWTSTSPTDPWFSPSFSVPQRAPLPIESFNASASRPLPAQSRNRAASQSSLSSSFIFRPPTSPLAKTSELTDSDERERSRSRSPAKSSRRYTFSPRSLRASQYSPPLQSSTFAQGRPYPVLRREESDPYQRREQRRSIAALPNLHHYSSPQTPASRSRRSSMLSDGSPLQAPMVGGYEESILRGRMSTLPSRPLDFVAQIGVLGKGECKKSLRCPAHISIPFPAVYYNYGNSTEGSSFLGGPSPYVGLIDMENSTGRDSVNANGNSTANRPETPASDAEPLNVDEQMIDSTIEPQSKDISNNNMRSKGRQRLTHAATASRKTPKGGYRIPQQGQLQIIIKNPNKTAVKLFLIPYDLTGMEAGQKTFIRQRSYSAGPIIDMPLSARKNFGSDRPEASLSTSSDPNDRPVLRYLIHLHICCPSRGRFYLYRSIRVVFANRVPDGKEKLRNEIQLPEPRYSTFKLDAASKSLQQHKTKESFAPTPTAPFEQQHYGFEERWGEDSLRTPRLPLTDTILSFARKPIVEVPSPGSGSTRKSDEMLVDSPNTSTLNSTGRVAEPGVSEFGGDHVMKHSDVGTQAKEAPASPRSGLLSLQLRDLASNGTSRPYT